MRKPGALLAALCVLALAVAPRLAAGTVNAAPGDGDPYAAASATLKPPHGGTFGMAASGGASAATVFGPDDREFVSDTTASPYRLGAELVFYNNAGVAFYECSGVFLNYNVVLTAAHCLYHDFGYVTSIEIGPGVNAEKRPFGTVTATRAVVPRGFTLSRAAEYDFGLVMFDGAPFGDALAPYPALVTAPNSFFDQPGTVLTTFGYPGDKPALTMWKAAGPLEDYDADGLFTTIDAYPGQSGSPLFATNGAAAGPRFVGLLITESDRYNRALRFTERNVGALRGFCVADPSHCTFDAYSTPPPYSLATHVVCRTSPRCTSGAEALHRGAPVRFALTLSPTPAKAVRLEAWVGGSLLGQMNWPPGPYGPGQVFDGGSGLVFGNASGQVALRVFVGDEYIGSLTAYLPAEPLGPPSPPIRPFAVHPAGLARD